jgi:hypothetical protein
MYAGVPTGRPNVFVAPPSTRAMPKSLMTTRP